MSASSGPRTKLAAGALGGLAGVAAMQLVHEASSPLVRPRTRKPGPQRNPDGDASRAIARIAYSRVVGRAPTSELETALSVGVQIGYGLVTAAMYSLLRGLPRRHLLRDGLLFGTGLWFLGDEVAAPLLGLADKPTAYSASQHVQALAAHVGFGISSTLAIHYLERALSRS